MSDKEVYVYYHHISSFFENIEMDIVISFALKTLYTIFIIHYSFMVIILNNNDCLLSLVLINPHFIKVIICELIDIISASSIKTYYTYCVGVLHGAKNVSESNTGIYTILFTKKKVSTSRNCV